MIGRLTAVRGIRMSIGRRLALLGAIGLVVALITNGVSLLVSSRVGVYQAELRTHLTAVNLVRQLDTRAAELKVDGYKALLSSTPTDLRQDLADDTQTVTDLLAALNALPLEDDDKEQIASIGAEFDGFLASIDTIIEAAVVNQTRAQRNFEDIQTANDATDEVLGNFADFLELNIQELEDQTATASRQLAVLTLLLLAAGVLVVVVGTVLLARPISRRAADVVQAMKRISDGDLSRRIGDTGTDEIGEISRVLDSVTDRIREVFASIGGTAAHLRSASSELTDVAAQVGRSVTQTSQQATVVSRTADEVSSNVQAVAAGGEEMTVSIAEIARNAQEAARVATGAVSAVETTTGTMNKLGDSSREIGDVVKLITSIAEQTNLLALNATIEAARAGDAGKGFAVVADEVKQLAQETARATEDISKRVETIQEDADSATSAITEIANVIAQINEFQTTIASAVEEQTATTQSINAGVSTAADGSSEIAHNISGVAAAADATTANIGKAESSARELSEMSDELARLVAGFRL